MAPPDANTTVIEVTEPKLEHTVSEKTGLSIDKAEKLKDGAPDSPEIEAAPPVYDAESNQEKDDESDGAIIITGTDAAKHLLPMRDDGEPALSFRSIVLSTGLAAFQAVMYQIYTVGPSQYSVYCFLQSLTLSSRQSTVQTDANHYWGDIHRPHCLFPGQCMGGRSAAW